MTVHDVARGLPEIAVLREHCRSLAVLEMLLSHDSAHRRHFFDDRWSETESMASMENGSGDGYSIVFSPAGACIRGFDHESPMSPYGEADGPWPGVIDEVPEVFRSWVEEPAFSDEYGMLLVTACVWRETGDGGWNAGRIDFPDAASGDPDGAGSLFRLLVDRSPEAFQRWAEDYYEVPVDLDAVRHVLSSRPLTGEVVRALNPGGVVTDHLVKDVGAVGYPTR